MGSSSLEFVDCQIILGGDSAQGWTGEIIWKRPHEDAEIRQRCGTGPVFDLNALCRTEHLPEEHGTLLTDALFAVPELREGFVAARSAAIQARVPMRLRLTIDKEAGQLHSAIWETLRDPNNPQEPLVFAGDLVFSRYLRSQDWPSVLGRTKAVATRRAMIFVANPGTEDLALELAPIPVDEHVESFQRTLVGFQIDTIASQGAATLPALLDAMDRGPDIAVIVCHGFLSDDDLVEPVVLLEDAQGGPSPVRGLELVRRMRQLSTRPGLVVLASCVSAGNGPSGTNTLAALGPVLAAAGIPAVVAMQGEISSVTMVQFLHTLYTELQRHGVVDQAMQSARRAVQHRPDWWMPVLFTRSLSGRVWSDLDRFGRWEALISHILKGKCTPILGPCLTDNLLPSRSEIAGLWAAQRGYRIPGGEFAADLARVAQWLAITQNVSFPGERFVDEMRKAVQDPGEPIPADGAGLHKLIRQAVASKRSANEFDPLALLAKLPLKLFVTTQPVALLEDAIKESGRDADSAWCRWRDDVTWPAQDVFSDPDYQPSERMPVVYHLSGCIDDPLSLVLTEDDYLDYVIAVSRNANLIPHPVWRAMADSALVLLGFRMEDWDFRGLLRVILNQEGSENRRKYTHVAVQIDPADTIATSPKEFQAYVEGYFRKTGRHIEIDVYWGSVEEFVIDLYLKYQSSKES